MKLSRHARVRAQQRGIPEQHLVYVHSLGSETNAIDGATRYIMTNKACDECIAHLKRQIAILEKARGKAVVARDGMLLTAYHAKVA